jgi:large subunit ribosomal protein L1
MSEETNVENIAPEPIKEAPKSKKKRVPKRKRAHAVNPKKRKAAEAKIELGKQYSLSEAMTLIKQVNTAKFDASVDVHVRLGVDPKKADQGIRGTVVLPHGTGKTKTVLVFCTADKEDEARAAGADHVGLDELIKKVQGGWTDFDVVVAMPSVMAKIGRLGRVLGPRGLMPNPKTGTVTPNIGAAVEAVKGGKISFRVDKNGIIHSSIGRVSFEPKKLAENANELLTTLLKMKPSTAKGIYMKSVTVASTMSPGIPVDTKSIK